MSDSEVGWRMDREKLRGLLVLTDEHAKRFSKRAGPAFFRAFIVENRETGYIMARYRFCYRDQDSWYEVRPSAQEDAIESLRRSISYMIEVATAAYGTPSLIGFHAPPDDQGNPDHTVAWLLERDLVEITEIKL